MATLYELTTQMAAIEQTLDDNGGELTPELEQLWAETAESLPAKIDNYNALIQNLEAKSKTVKAQIDIFQAEIDRLKALQKSEDNKVRRIKEHIINVMETTGLTKLEGDRCKMSLSSSTCTEVDEETILAPYVSRIDRLMLPEWVTCNLKVSKTALKDAFKDKDVTPAGVKFVSNKSLRIR